jgi:hypothetical protein
MCQRIDMIASQLAAPGLWRPLRPQALQDSGQSELDLTPQEDANNFSYSIQLALDPPTVVRLIDAWQNVAHEMETWTVNQGLVGPQARGAMLPPKYQAPLWRPQVSEIKVFDYQAANSWREPVKEALERIDRLFDEIKVGLAIMFMDYVASLVDPFVLVDVLAPDASKKLLAKELLYRTIDAVVDIRNSTNNAIALALFDQLSSGKLLLRIERLLGIWNSVDCPPQIQLRNFLSAQSDTWLGLTIARSHPEIASLFYRETLPAPWFPDLQLAPGTWDENDDSDDESKYLDVAAFEATTDFSGSVIVRLKYPYSLMCHLRELCRGLISTEGSPDERMRVRHPHIQRRISLLRPGQKPESLSLARNGIFVGSVGKVTRGGRRTMGDSDLGQVTIRDVLVRVGRHEICRPS